MGQLLVVLLMTGVEGVGLDAGGLVSDLTGTREDMDGV